jgi:hypothetical protein
MKSVEENKNETNKILEKIQSKKNEFEKLREKNCYLFLGNEITKSIVGDIFDDLRSNYSECNGKLDVIIDSGGGDINSAYNLSALFRRFGTEELIFLIPRWAKSAATLLACGGDKILMTPIAELGPLDPIITTINPLESRLEQFSPLHIESTLDLIREEFMNGNKDLAEKLIERLQFPLTLGSYMKSIEIGEQYLIKLLSSRMLKNDLENATTVAHRLTTGYTDHGYCINCNEAREIGLIVNELEGSELDIVWEIFKLYDEKRKIEKKNEQKKMLETIKEIPQELIGTPTEVEKQKNIEVKKR